MTTFYIVLALILIACVLLVLVVLIQNPKGGGLGTTFGGSSQVFGVRQTADFLEKATWVLAIAIISLSLFSSALLPREKVKATSESAIKDMSGKTQSNTANPVPNSTVPPTQN